MEAIGTVENRKTYIITLMKVEKQLQELQELQELWELCELRNYRKREKLHTSSTLWTSRNDGMILNNLNNFITQVLYCFKKLFDGNHGYHGNHENQRSHGSHRNLEEIMILILERLNKFITQVFIILGSNLMRIQEV